MSDIAVIHGLQTSKYETGPNTLTIGPALVSEVDSVVDAAREQLGMPYVRHSDFSNRCLDFPVTNPHCMEGGIGPNAFDCSGLVIASLLAVGGYSLENWPQDLRHTRQIHSAATRQEKGLRISDDIAVGRLAVFSRTWKTSDGRRVTVAGHIGIISSVGETGFSMVHSSHSHGRVVETNERTADLVGIIDITELAL